MTEQTTKPLSKAAARDELLVMAHRYLYYVESDPVLTDHEYDKIERAARARPDLAESPIQKVGSSLADDYTEEQIKKAKELLAKAGR